MPATPALWRQEGFRFKPSLGLLVISWNPVSKLKIKMGYECSSAGFDSKYKKTWSNRFKKKTKLFLAPIHPWWQVLMGIHGKAQQLDLNRKGEEEEPWVVLCPWESHLQWHRSPTSYRLYHLPIVPQAGAKPSAHGFLGHIPDANYSDGHFHVQAPELSVLNTLIISYALPSWGGC